MKRRLAVLNVVGLTRSLLGSTTPRLCELASAGSVGTIAQMVPAVTCSVQSTYLTGTPPRNHGIVANGWYDRESCEVRFWRQASGLVQRPRLWDLARKIDPSLTFANVCWWFAMYSSADYAVTPRPIYPADGRKIPDVWTSPSELRGVLQQQLGQFPLFRFWGPATSIESSRWIARAATWIEQRHRPDVSLVYLPHLDYCLQSRGPEAAGIQPELAEIDAVCADLLDLYLARGVDVIVLSEYGIGGVSRPVHLNRQLREHGLVTVREELGRELLDAGASPAFAVADHQVAHVYVQHAARLGEVAALLRSVPGVAAVWDADAQHEHGIDHARSGDLVALAEPDSWFTYYYWLDDERAPDFARTVDIHRKPGFDPVELFVDPRIRLPKLRVATTLARKAIGLRTLMELTPLDARLVRGSHGLPVHDAEAGPILITSRGDLLDDGDEISATAVCALLLDHVA